MPDFRSTTVATVNEEINGDPGLMPYWGPRHLQWLSRPRYEKGPSDAAIAHAMRVYYNEDVPERSGEQTHRFSASQIGGEHGEGFACHRASLFNYARWPKLPPTPQEVDNMEIGNALHLAYQMEGLSAGYITSCETWDWSKDFETGGKDDGIQDDGSLLELKFTKGEKFDQILNGARQFGRRPGPIGDHEFQIAVLMWLKKLDYASLVYVNRENGAFKEFRRKRTQDAAVTRIITDLQDYAVRDVLPKMLPRCVEGRGYQFEHCSWRDRCPKATSIWTQP